MACITKTALCVFVLIGFTITLGGLSPANAAKRKDCGSELKLAYKQFLRDLRINNFKTGAASGSGKEAKRLTAYLKKTHKKIVKHEEAHKNAAGKWGGEIKYMYYTWWNIPYAVAGCHIPKKGIPLKVALKSLLAPDQPSKWDLESAEKIKTYIEKGYKR